MTLKDTGRRMVLAILILGPLALLGCGKGGESQTDGRTQPTIKTKSGIEMVVIPAGAFEMGSRQGGDEGPVHKVAIDSFLMDKYETTQAVYEKIGPEADPPLSNVSRFRGSDLPVEMVTWPQAARFCNARSRVEGLAPCYEDDGSCNFTADGYRLPTEAEWEYACRAGTTTDYSFGTDKQHVGDFGWLADNSGKKTHPVGEKRPNPWGLYDMHGNVAEWCNDAYDKGYYQNSPEKNPHGPAADKRFVLRGGSWKATADGLRSSARVGEVGGFSDACLAPDVIGFRCVRKAPPEGSVENSRIRR